MPASTCILHTLTLLVLGLLFARAGDTSTSFSLSSCQRFTNYAFASYCSAASIEAWDCAPYCTANPGFQTVLYDSNVALDSAAVVGYNPETSEVLVLFRGSYNIPNAIEDIDAPLVEYEAGSNILLHMGFYEDYSSHQPAINTALAAIYNSGNCTDCALFVTGHSLGAAIANIASYDIKQTLTANNWNGQVYSYTFGSPRTGNNYFAQAYRDTISTHLRVVHRYDPVPHLPSYDQDAGIDDYWHVDTEIWEYPQLTFNTCNSDNLGDSTGLYEQANCSDSVVVTVVTDHLEYCDIQLDPFQCGGDPLTV